MKKKTSDKELDLIDLGLRDVYSACYAFGFALLCLALGIALSCASSSYEDTAPHLAFLIVGLILVAFSLSLVVLGFLFLKKDRQVKEGALLRCPLQSKKIIRNGYLVGTVLCAIGITTLVVGMLQFPEKPIHGVALLAGSTVVLFYGILLLISTVRDHLIVKKASPLTASNK